MGVVVIGVAICMWVCVLDREGEREVIRNLYERTEVYCNDDNIQEVMECIHRAYNSFDGMR